MHHTPDQLQTIGEALYGLRWQSPLARDLWPRSKTDMSRTVRYWLSGERAIPDHVWPQLARLLERRAAVLSRLAKLYG